MEDNPDVLLGRIAVYAKALSREKVENALEEWLRVAGQLDFGTFLVVNNYLTAATLDELILTRDKYMQRQQGAMDVAPAVASTAAHGPTPAAARATRPMSGSALPVSAELAEPKPEPPVPLKKSPESVLTLVPKPNEMNGGAMNGAAAKPQREPCLL